MQGTNASKHFALSQKFSLSPAGYNKKSRCASTEPHYHRCFRTLVRHRQRARKSIYSFFREYRTRHCDRSMHHPRDRVYLHYTRRQDSNNSPCPRTRCARSSRNPANNTTLWSMRRSQPVGQIPQAKTCNKAPQQYTLPQT
jgi:hypothetical protein